MMSLYLFLMNTTVVSQMWKHVGSICWSITKLAAWATVYCGVSKVFKDLFKTVLVLFPPLRQFVFG